MTVIAQAYVEGVSTRRGDDLAKAMGIEGISSSEVSRVAGELDGGVAEFRDRRLDSGPYRYVWIDVLTQKVREGGRVVNVSAVVATAVNVEGRREIIGFDVVTSETTEGWTTFLRSLVARGLSSWSFPTPTVASRPRLGPCWPVRRGRGAELTSWRTWPRERRSRRGR